LETVPEPMIVPAPEIAGLGEVGDEGAEVEGHVDTGVGAAEWLAVEVDLQHDRGACRRPTPHRASRG
jgi:hypothetical protein